MKKLLLALILLPLLVGAQTEERILTMTSFTIKQGHSVQFEDGVKKYNECYVNDDGKETWNFWKRAQGEGTVYGVTSFMDKWAEMDENDTAGKDCYAIVTNYIMPHIESMSSAMAMTMPDWSRATAPEGTGLAWVTYYDVKDTVAFRDVISQVISVMKEKEGDSRAYWYNVMGGGADDPDYMVSTIYPNFAALDIEKDSPYEMYVKSKGEKSAKKLSDIWYKAVNDSWSYIWEFKSEMSL